MNKHYLSVHRLHRLLAITIITWIEQQPLIDNHERVKIDIFIDNKDKSSIGAVQKINK